MVDAGMRVLVVEARQTVGGGTRTAELTEPGFLHDVCSSVHPLALGSPWLRSLPLEAHGARLITPPVAVAHPLDNQPAAALRGSVEETAALLAKDGRAYRRLMAAAVDHWQALIEDILAPLRMPRHPLRFARFGVTAALPASVLIQSLFRHDQARALLAGMAGHAILPLNKSPGGGLAMMLAMLGHAVGWPIVEGGSQNLANALAAILVARGGEICTEWEVRTIDELPPARAVLFDTTPRQLLRLAGERLPAGYARRLAGFQYNPGVFKIDWALSGRVPWRDETCAQTATVHLGGRFEEIAASEKAVWVGEHPARPYVIFVQPSLYDATRAPEGQHTAWAYCHVPNGSTVDMTARIEAQVERFAPGFGDVILARHTLNTHEMEAYNANYVGGDINGGVQNLWQHFVRPATPITPYRTPAPGIYLCSSSTPPGGGVHGMCGYHAAAAVIADR